mmetsp:Transcript_29109/g.58130  ORF Transcript_29109/g.58130 Transcript_29109/m.58130 type:complete len:144 (-) Transcript_29109:14-445(-)
MGLKGNLPSEIGELDGLRVLDLSCNEISSIPPEIGKLTSLTELELGRNHLADLPRELGNLRSLTDLRLHNNRLSVLREPHRSQYALPLQQQRSHLTFHPQDMRECVDEEWIQSFLAWLKNPENSEFPLFDEMGDDESGDNSDY